MKALAALLVYVNTHIYILTYNATFFQKDKNIKPSSFVAPFILTLGAF